MNIKKLINCLGLSCLVVGLSACQDGNMSDLQSKIQTIKDNTVKSIKELPPVVEYQPFAYEAFELRSPFAEIDPEFETRLLQIEEGCDSVVQPDPNRRKYELERFGLDALQYVGMLSNKKELRGLIKIQSGESAGVVQPVHVGEYIGLDDGKIISIASDQITIEAIIPNSKGCWEQRPQYLVLGG